MGKTLVGIYFMGAYKKCELVNHGSGRYVCTAEGYDIYDAEDFEERYLAVKSI